MKKIFLILSFFIISLIGFSQKVNTPYNVDTIVYYPDISDKNQFEEKALPATIIFYKKPDGPYVDFYIKSDTLTLKSIGFVGEQKEEGFSLQTYKVVTIKPNPTEFYLGLLFNDKNELILVGYYSEKDMFIFQITINNNL